MVNIGQLNHKEYTTQEITIEWDSFPGSEYHNSMQYFDDW